MTSTGPISSVNRILLGHAVSLVTLELEQPARSRVERSTLHALALASMFDRPVDARQLRAQPPEHGIGTGRKQGVGFPLGSIAVAVDAIAGRILTLRGTGYVFAKDQDR